MQFRALAMLVAAMVLATGCVTQKQRIYPGFHKPATGARVVFMEPVVAVSMLTAGGTNEPRADWTETARANLAGAVASRLRTKGYTVAEYDPSLAPERQKQLALLEKAVTQSALVFGPPPALATLPTKKVSFDWSLGPGAADLATAYGADYAIFLSSETSIASGGRVATGILAAALLGVAVPMGGSATRISLVDLKTGQLVWMEVAAFGDARDPASAGAIADALMKTSPL